MSLAPIHSFKGLPVDHEQGLVSGPAQADVDLFNNAMRQDHGVSGHLADGMVNAISDRLQSQGRLSEQAMRAMKVAAGSADPMDVVKMSRSLSQYSLQMAMTTKVVSKGAQALDKLTNLQ
ncbi:EscI/YscI/HrpB family type III secretion system inner rod protein [Pseudomonas gingeri NCPPB 3146 = LMG 5327]|uniref:Type III secretion system inner rod subunit SctI n=3 Tax=Pseudomonas gingeri TaxID=117681 RepID=A0A7Y7Y5C0_9PSED|nr:MULTISPECIES: type III secretion system inner rod subunit SctI [Pseudomonas]NVZ28562.1 type III secretion system inner rod subunit SctI [Pseudomonas gingeri]NVZ62660.1 type III secretion system inner rod subunit SctI [Pseudomonas gingeri]NVZ76606.1 type III secretion system inner rod subunit SctI [Pseudomonas gingeri]NWC18181.1 type III secretion system inner rod subunit SctI [Pseudomonas gingeri]NWE49195.1 type III secretion system inner rod subunit SctI [Pseudomonas gingeri]